jgi:hypothetical protein
VAFELQSDGSRKIDISIPSIFQVNSGFVGPLMARLDDLYERGDQHQSRTSVISLERRVQWNRTIL